MPPPLEKYCCCSLKTAVIVISILNIIGTPTFLFVSVNNLSPSSSGKASLTTKDSTSESEEVKLIIEKYSQPGCVTPLQICYVIIKIIFCLLLFAAIYKKNRYFLLPWLVISSIEFSVCGIVVFVGIFLLGVFHYTLVIITLIGLFIYTVINWSFWVAVYSYYVFLKEEPSGADAA